MSFDITDAYQQAIALFGRTIQIMDSYTFAIGPVHITFFKMALSFLLLDIVITFIFNIFYGD